MKKRSIAIVMGTLFLGGAERALINMLNHFDYEKYRVVLWICGEEPGNVSLVPKQVEVRHIKSEFALPDTNRPTRRPIPTGKRLWARFLAKLNISNDQKNKHYYCMSLPRLSSEKYDCVIAYRGWDAAVLRFAFYRLNAEKRIVWMHNDTYDTSFPFPQYYRKADKIFCVSKTIQRHMQEKYTGLTGKLAVFYNILDEKDVLEKAKQPCDEELKHPAILSVGRLSWEKGFDMIPETAYLLKQQGYDFYWYIIGEGYKRREIEPKIQEYQVQDNVFLLGAKSNPYPYFKNCDIFVQTSLTEGYCITTAEAKVFHKPVVTTNLPVMYEQFTNRENGMIAEEISPSSLAESIAELMKNPTLCAQLSDQLRKESRTFTTDFQNLYAFIDA